MRYLPYVGALKRTSFRTFCTSGSCEKGLFAENVSAQRSLIRVSGQQKEVEQFLQGLMTNDINHVAAPKTDAAMYTMFLNKPGRVLYDAIVYKRRTEPQSFYIECDRTLDSNLQQHLRLFRVRKKIDIDTVRDDFDIWAVFQPHRIADKKATGEVIENALITKCNDPRLAALGWRIVAPKNVDLTELGALWPNQEIGVCTELSPYNYRQHRYVHGICEGVDEIPTTKCFPFDVNCDYLHGISFHKGCYLGQEFTARTYHTGVIRKRVMPIRLETSASDDDASKVSVDTPISNDQGKAVGKLKGLRHGNAIGLLRIDLALNSKFLTFGELKGTASCPDWWPVASGQNKPRS